MRLGKVCFGVGALTGGGEEVVIESEIERGIPEGSVERCRSMARLFANLVNAGGLLLIAIASPVGC